MTRAVLYVAAPLRPTEDEFADAKSDREFGPPLADAVAVGRALRANLDRAMRWLAWLRRSFPETTFIAPWIATIMSLDGDDSPALREAGLVDDCAVIERCDGIVLCGGRISDGMRREMEHGVQHALAEYDGGPCPFEVYSLADLVEPPLGGPPEYAFGGRSSFHDYARAREDS